MLIGSCMLCACPKKGGSPEPLATPPNTPPIAAAGSDLTVLKGTAVRLDGSQSIDPDGDALTFQWSQELPPGSHASLTGANTATPSFVADVRGKFTAHLVTADGKDSSPAATVNVTAKAFAQQSQVGYGAYTAASADFNG
ncbi:MAG: hypothetical protein KDC98_08240, partial [Planctomycetes bacterium]|nr:hypothetical protein [Planctomycetota bacterium]